MSEPQVALRLGRWEHVLSRVTCDALITDPPYSEATQSGHNASARVGDEREYMRVDRRTGAVYSAGKNRRKQINYSPFTPADVRSFVEHWSPRTRGWFVVFSDDVLAPIWKAELKRQGRYAFSPLSYLVPGGRFRRVGDGPSQWSVFITVARPRTPEFFKWGSLPGGYVHPAGVPRRASMIGGKAPWIMEQLISDYTRPGNVVCDPCAGMATTLISARNQGRHAIGAESSPETHARALQLLAGFAPAKETVT